MDLGSNPTVVRWTKRYLSAKFESRRKGHGSYGWSKLIQEDGRNEAPDGEASSSEEGKNRVGFSGRYPVQRPALGTSNRSVAAPSRPAGRPPRSRGSTFQVGCSANRFARVFGQHSLYLPQALVETHGDVAKCFYGLIE